MATVSQLGSKGIFPRCFTPRVLHCVERMHTNAIESWLARMHRHAIRTGRPVEWDFHVQFDAPGSLEKSYGELSGRIIRSRSTLSKPLAFFRDFYMVCRHTRYDVVHVHADIMSAPYLVAARLAGRPKLVVHVHNADQAVPVGNAVKKALLREPMRRMCWALADKVVGISNHTLDTFLRGGPRRPGRDLVHYYGIDPEPYLAASADRARFREEIGVPQDSLILLFASRLVPEKNPRFALEVLNELRKLEPRAVGVFVGNGSEEEPLRRLAGSLQLGNVARFLGWRSDIPEVMSCCDWFILPRPEQPMEGFGIAVVEAQLAGLRLVISKGIADDPLLPGSCVRRLSLTQPARVWAQAACSLLRESAPGRETAAMALANSPMNMDRALTDLLWLYEG